MNSILPVYTKPLPVSSEALLHDFFSRVATRVTVPNCYREPTPKALREVLRGMKDELQVWEREISLLLPFENLSPDDLKRVEYLRVTIDHYTMALFGYSEKIDMSFLSEKKGDLPYFGVTDTQNRGMQLSVYKSTIFSDVKFSIHPELPEDLKSYYRYVSGWLSERYGRDQIGKVFLSARPSGKMPSHLKERLLVSQRSGLFQGGIYIVFDAEWQLNEDLAIVKDPLVIGRSFGEYSRQYQDYLIGMYDPTPMEEWVATTHAKSPKT